MDQSKESAQSSSSSKQLWEQVNERDRQSYTDQKPLLKSQFRIKKNTRTSSIHIHLYASIILFICASTPTAKISLGPSVHYQLEEDSNSLIIGKKEKTFQLRLDGSDNMVKWAETLDKLGIPQKILPTENFLLEEANTESPSNQPAIKPKAAPQEEVSSSCEHAAADMYAAPETFKPSMEHFIIRPNYNIARRTCRDTNLFWNKVLERIPEEQDCCE